MNNRIFKWTLAVKPREMLYVTEGTTFISVAEQNEQLVLYGISPAGTQLEQRFIRVATTGEPCPPGNFIGTAILRGWFVAHVFEQNAKEEDQTIDRYADDFRTIQKEISSSP